MTSEGIVTLEDRGIRIGIEVFVRDPVDSDIPERKATVIRTYPKPSRWLVVKYDSGDIEQVEERYVTTMFEKTRKRLF